jgi:glucose/arabinose dehydrogenase/PKD repeat protein
VTDRRSWARFAAVALGVLIGIPIGIAAPPPAQAGVEQPGFTDTAVITGLTLPTSVEFASDGRIFVAEKSGLIRVFPSLASGSSTVFADLRPQVHDFWDRGLLGLALHPDFPADPRVYVSYTHDAAVGGTAPTWGDDCPNPPGATLGGCVVSGRLSIITASGNVGGPEQVLIEDWCQQYPSHTIGDLAFGADGALYVSGGDGASFNFVDYGQHGNVCGDPPSAVGGPQTIPTSEGGALRSQDLRTAADPVGLDGTILRLDPDTGAALPDNPLAGETDTNAQRIVAYGLRNPFRIAMRPGTSEVWLGDVGWGGYEEVNRVVPGAAAPTNFGWPCYEGDNQRLPTYEDLSICADLYADGADAVARPILAYRHGEPAAGDTCITANGSSISGITFYAGGAYPDSYDGALFVSDYSRRCIWVVFAGADGLPDPSTMTPFVSGASFPVQLTTGPAGDVFYVNINDGAIHRIEYGVPNEPPVAVIAADPTEGPAPLSVSFDGSASFDPEGDPLQLSWDLDADGQFGDAITAQTSHTYDGGTYDVRLRATDSRGVSDIATVRITATGTVYLSDLPFEMETNAWGPVERDRSNGEQAAGDGNPLRLDGVTFARGLGVHAASEVRLTVPAGCSRLLASLGVDDEVGDLGRVRFAVDADDSSVYESPVLTGADAAVALDLAVSPGSLLSLQVSTEGSPDHDHADWADARFACDDDPPPPPPENAAPVIAPLSDREHEEGAEVLVQVEATDPDGDSLTYELTGMPAGVSIDAETGAITGTIGPGASSSSPFVATVTVTDERGAVAEATFGWTVALPPSPPVPAPAEASARSTTVEVDLSWEALPAEVAGVTVERSLSPDGPWDLLTPTPLAATTFRDSGPPPEPTLHYRLTSVANDGRTSNPVTVEVPRVIRLVATETTGARARNVVIPDLPGLEAGDLEIVTITMRGAHPLSAPAGWTLLRTDSRGTTITQAIYHRLVDPEVSIARTWAFPRQVTAIGTVVAYRGVDAAVPIEVHSGRTNGSSRTLAANAITTVTDNAAIVAFYGIARDTTVALPSVLAAREGRSLVVSSQRIAAWSGDGILADAGPAGNLDGRATQAAASVVHVLALRPGGPP